MAQKKVNLQRIANDKTRITTYKKRKACLFKKAGEFSTLCGVETCLIVYGPTKATDEVVSEPEIWPRDENKARDIIRRYRNNVSNSSRKENNVETFVNDIGKGKDQGERLNNKKVKNNNKYSSWEEKLGKCSQEELRGILCAVEKKLFEAMTRHDRSMFRAHHHHQVMETPNPQSLMDQYYMPQYVVAEQQQLLHQPQPLMWPSMGLQLIQDQVQIDPTLMDNWNDLGLNQGLMMPKVNDGQLSQMYAPFYNFDQVIQRPPAFNLNPFAGYHAGLDPWRLHTHQDGEWEPLEKKQSE